MLNTFKDISKILSFDNLIGDLFNIGTYSR